MGLRFEAGEQVQAGDVTINVGMDDDVRVRQALNMASNEERIVRTTNNRAVPATISIADPMRIPVHYEMSGMAE